MIKFILRISPELVIKSKHVRKKGVRMLQRNLARTFQFHGIKVLMGGNWDIITVEGEHEKPGNIQRILQDTPGVGHFMEVEEVVFDKDYNREELFNEIGDRAISIHKNFIDGKAFVVRVKRVGVHDFTSVELEAYVGGKLLHGTDSGKVDLHSPEYTVQIEVKEKKVFLIKQKIAGIEGYPIGFQENVLSLISGGFDSGVSSYSMMKRGCKLDYLFFNLGGKAHEIGVKQVSYYLWKKFSIPHKKAHFITVDFAEFLGELVEKIAPEYRGILLKRAMLKVSSQICEIFYYALVKGDSLGQVSSQTLKNMHVIDKASESLVLRPLISHNKQEIIDISHQIGTYNYACNMPEYCGAISDKSSVGAELEIILEEEKKLDESILERAFTGRKLERIINMLDSEEFFTQADTITIQTKRSEDLCIIDIREPEKIKNIPFKSDMTIPFFRINAEFSKLDQSKTYGLYCDKGVLSQLHGLYLQEQGFTNIVVFREEK